MDGLYKIGALTGIMVVLVVLGFSAQPVLSASNESATTASVSVNEYISVTLGNVPISFPNQNPGAVDQPATVGQGYPMTVTVESITNVNTNISLNGSDFTGAGTFGVGNLSYSNDSAGTKTTMTTTFSSGSPVYSDWVNIPAPGGGPSATRNSYFWISIPSGQTAGAYSNNVLIRVETA